ncbi:MAG: hypothetical protein AB7W59_00290 [Acidimicrobiia bacterium]
MRREKVRQLALAQLQLEQARAQVGRAARGCTMDEVEGGRLAAAKMLRENDIPVAALANLDAQDLELLVDTYLEHEDGRR